MRKKIKVNRTRDNDKELRDTTDQKYAYTFDFDGMQRFMLRSCEPFFRQGSLLELGSYKGIIPKLFLPYFNEITCVEASEEAITIAKKELGQKVKFIHSLFETVTLPTKYDNIILTHVLEHIDKPVSVLNRINNE